MISDDVLDILACPVCKGRLLQDAVKLTLFCLPCGLAYPVRNGIPVLLAAEAAKLEVQTQQGTR